MAHQTDRCFKVAGTTFLWVLLGIFGSGTSSRIEAQPAPEGGTPTLSSAPKKVGLDNAIRRSKEMLSRFKGGHVVLGRIILDGPGDPRDVAAQMEILSGGYFVGETRDLERPIGFRMHQYHPVDVPLKAKRGDLVDLGEIHMTPIAPADRVGLRGRVLLAPGEDAQKAKITLSVLTPPVNTPHNGSSPRSHWAAPIQIHPGPDGRFATNGFAPIAYYVKVEAPGYYSQSKEIQFSQSKELDLENIRLLPARTLKLRYIVATKPSFNPQKIEETTIRGDVRWKATPDIYGWDLEFKAGNDRLVFNYSYGPCSLTDLGAGTLEEFSKTDGSADGNEFTPRAEVKAGHVYLLNQGHWKRWVLFSVEDQ